MTRYGVKTKSGKVVWVLADAVELREGMIVFVRTDPENSTATPVAGFNMDVVDHFGRPDAFATEATAGAAAANTQD